MNKMVTDLLVASEFSNFKMRYLLVDAKSEAFDRLIAELKTKAAALQRRYLVVAGGQQVGAFPETTLEGFVSAITLLTQRGHPDQNLTALFLLEGRVPVR